MSNKSTLGLLLGAGFSKPSGLPLANDMTRKILLGQHFESFLGTISERSWQTIPNPDRRYAMLRCIPLMTALLNIIRNTTYFDVGRLPNYEDAYDIAREYPRAERSDSFQAFEDSLEGKTIQNAFVDPDCKQVTSEGDLYSGREPAFMLGYIALELQRYLEYVFRIELGGFDFENPADEWRMQNPYLRLLDEIRKSELTNVPIITLNHDMLLEKWFWHHKIDFTDGFEWNDMLKTSGRVIGKYGIWAGFNAPSIQCDFELLKLHGSIFWYPVDEALRWWESEYCPRLASAIEQNSIAAFSSPNPCRDNWCTPALVTGTTMKTKLYTQPPIRDLMSQTQQRLREIDLLIIIGYSFSDEKINELVGNWSAEDNRRKIVRICPCDSELPRSLGDEFSRMQTIDCEDRAAEIDGFWTLIKKNS